MPQIFHRSFNTVSLVSIYGAVFLLQTAQDRLGQRAHTEVFIFGLVHFGGNGFGRGFAREFGQPVTDFRLVEQRVVGQRLFERG